MMIAAPKSTSKNVEDGGNFSADSPGQQLNSDDEQLDDTPFLSHQLPDDHESFSEKFLRNILTHDYQNLMPRRREKFVEITKTVTVTEIVNGAPDKHPSSCEVKVTNVSPAGPHPVNVSIKHLHEKWHSCEELDKSDDGGDLGKGTVIRIQETHKPFNYTQKKHQKPTKFVYEDVVNTKMESSTRSRSSSSPNTTQFNRSSDNIIDLEFRHPILVETTEKTDQKTNGTNGTRRRFADLRKKVSTTTKTSVTETEKVTTTRRSSSAHSTSSRRSYSKPEVHTLYYRKFVDEETKGGDNESSDSGSVIIHRDSVTRRSRSADPLQRSPSPTMSPIAPPRKRLGREESLHYYRDDEEVIGEQKEKTRRVTVRSPEPGNTSVSMNDTAEGRNITAGITSISMNDSCTDTSYESRFSTIPRARSSPPTTHRVNHIHVNVIGPIRTPETERRHRVVGRVGDDVTMDIFIERRHSAANSRRGSHVSIQEAPPKPPRKSKYEDHTRIGEPIATSTPMTTIERKQTRDERISAESGESSRKSTRSARPPDINIIECETFLRETRSPARTPATPIVVINQTPSSRRGSQDLLGEPGQRRRKSTVTDIDWYAAFNMKDPSSPTKLARPPFASYQDESRKSSRDTRRRASDSSMITIPPADIDLNQIFVCTASPEIKEDEKCQCNACRLIRMSEAERVQRMERSSRSRQSRSFTRTTEYETRSSTLPSRHRTSPVKIELEDIFNPKPHPPPSSSKPPTPPSRRRHHPPQLSPTSPTASSSFADESQHLVTSTTIDRKQVTPVTTNSRDSGSQLHENTRNQLLNSSDDWVNQMINDANEWENRVSNRKSSVLSTSSSTARKVSVARRISVDELRKPEKRKSREAVPLPPSDVSIDDIFTALTPKKEDKNSERKTFIVTRKQRAQDIDIIDFEKDRDPPIAPPRTKNTEATHISEANITLENKEDVPYTSTATINLKDVKSKEDSEKDNKKDKKVEIPYKEPQVTSTATIQMRPADEKREALPTKSSEVTLDDSEKETNPNRASAVSIDLNKVFVEGTSKPDENEISDEKIRRGIAEFERSKQEKEAQRSGIVEASHSSKHLFDESGISMDEVFNTSKPRKEPPVELKKSDEEESSSVVLSNRPQEVVTSSINLDNVFDAGDSQKELKEDEEDEHIRRRIEEFRRTIEEKESRMTTESHSSHRIFDESDISMDDVFNTSRAVKEPSVVIKESDDKELSSTVATAEPQEVATSSINFDNVFATGDIQKKQELDEEEEHIRQRIEEFKRTIEEKERKRTTESHSSHRIFDESNISMDDVFNTSSKPDKIQEETSEEPKVNSDAKIDESAKPIEKSEELTSAPITMRPSVKETKRDIEKVEEVSQTTTTPDNEEKKKSSATIDLNDIFVEGTSKDSEFDSSDEKIRRGIAEFERSKQEKEIQRSGIVESSHSSERILDDSNISMEVVFNPDSPSKGKEDKPEESSTASVSIEPSTDDTDKRPVEEKLRAEDTNQEMKRDRTSAVSIDLDKVFVEGTSKPDEYEISDEKIRRGIAEFERSKQEKEAQRSGIVETSHSSKHLFDESDISMDDVFNTSKSRKGPSVEIKKSDERKLSSIVLPDKSKEVVSASANLDNIFETGHNQNQKKSEIDEEEEHIRRRIEEFKKTIEEKESKRTTESHSSHRIFDESNISMDDVFNTSTETNNKKNIGEGEKEDKLHSTTTKTVEINLDDTAEHKPEKVETVRRDSDVDSKPNRTSAVSIDLNEVFIEGTSKPDENEISDEKIRRGIAEFERSKQEKEAQRTGIVETSHSTKHLFDESDISMDEVFNTTRKEFSVEKKEESDKPQEVATHFSFDNVFESGDKPKKSEIDEEEEHIRQRIEEFKRTREEKERKRITESHSSHKIFDESNISMDDVFGSGTADTKKSFNASEKDEPIHSEPSLPLILTTDEDETTKTKTTTKIETDTDSSSRKVYGYGISITNQSPSSSQNVISTESVEPDSVTIDLDDVFVEQKEAGSSKDTEDEKKIQRGIAEFERTRKEKESQKSQVSESSYSTKNNLDESKISLNDVFSNEKKKEPKDKEQVFATSSIRMRKSEIEEPKPSAVIEQHDTEDTEEKEKRERTSAVTIDLDKVFVKGTSKPDENEISDEKIRRGIAEFERSKQEKEAQRSGIVEASHSSKHLFDESDISLDDVFNTSKSRKEPPVKLKKSDERESSSVVLSDRPQEVATSSINLDNVFTTGDKQKKQELDEEEEHIRQRIEEFKRTVEEKESRMTTESHSSHRFFDESNISMDDVFNTSTSSNTQKPSEEAKSKPVFETSSISLEDVFNKTTDSGFDRTTSEIEKTSTTTTTTTETSSSSYSKKTMNFDDTPQNAPPPAISISAISLDQPSPTPPPRKHQNLSSLFVPGNWNESMISNASTISLDDSFNNSFVKSGNSEVMETKLRKPLTLPVDNWIDNLVATVTDEATKEAPKTPKSAIENYFRSPTRISQEIKYEWIANLINDNEKKEEQGEEEKGHQSEEEHLQKQDKTWVSSVTYRPTLETSAYTLRSSQMESEEKTEIDMNRVFDECLMGKNKDDEECECSACRLTEKELEAIQKSKIETEKLTREEKQIVSRDSEERIHHTQLNPSEFSIDQVFNPEVPLRIQTDNVQVPSTSSPPLQSTRTYYISPKISETVTTTHQWKDADISMDEIFSPVSSTTNENRRFSNFYEDRSGWDTIGSEDSGVMSGGDRGRRRSTRITDQITDHVIDEAFKGIFDSQPTTSSQTTKPDHSDSQYDDYYITSLHQEEVDRSDSDVDGDNLDVSQFVDDILGKSMDEAAFLSSTKSLRDHTDTSIDRKKSIEKVHSYYRTRTDTSMDRRVKPEVIEEDLETPESTSNDEILKLIFVDPAGSSFSKSESRRSLSLPRNKSTTKPSDEELLEIEIKPEYFLIKGSYSLLISKSDPLGVMLQKLREQNDSLTTLDFSLTRKLKKLLVNCIRERAGDLEMASSKYEGLLSSRGQSLIESIDHASATFLKMNVDKYEPTRNPNGVVNFCTAENNICTPLLEDRFKHLELFFPNTEHLVRYPPAGGWPEAREVLVKYFKEFMGARVTIDELALTPSTRTGYDVTSYCLFEQDDILLTNGPAYAGTISNVQEKAQCQVVCVETDLSNPRLDVKMYEAELNRQIELENTVSGVIIVNPHNPLGVTFPPEEVVNLCNWAASKNLQVVIDEVFANCVFDKTNSKFRPFLSYRHRVHRPENVAWLWSVSKDFGLPGLKFAVIHSANEGLRQAATKLQMYYPCSPFVQDFAINLLSDSEWLREFHTEVNRRISIHYRYTAQNLERLEIPFVPAQAGIFVFADFSKHLTSLDAVGELDLFERIASAGVMLTPGVHQKCHVFGWFRIVFACTKEELEEGFRRLFAHLGSHLHPIGTVHYDN